MSRLGKTMAGAGLFFAVTGILLSLAGSVMGADKSLDMRWGNHSFHLTPYNIRGVVSGDERRTEDTSLDPFTALDIDVKLGDVTIENGADYGVELSWSGERYELRYANENGILKVWDTGAETSFGAGYNASVTVYVPVEAALTDVSLNLSMGDASIYNLTTDKLSVDCDMGGADLNDITAQVLDINLDMGSVDLYGGTVGESLTARVAMGGAELYGDFPCDIDITANMGSVSLGLQRPASDYNCTLDSSMGSITVDGEEYSRNYHGGNGPHSLKASSSMGSVEIYFDN